MSSKVAENVATRSWQSWGQKLRFPALSVQHGPPLDVRQQLGRRKKRDGAFIKWASLTHRKKVNVSILTQHQMESTDQKRKKCSEEDTIMTKIKTAQIDRAGGARVATASPRPFVALLGASGLLRPGT